MKKHKFLKSTLCLLMALVCNVAWAQTSSWFKMGASTTSLSDGDYVLVAKSDKGTGPVFYDPSVGKPYRYDVSKTVAEGHAVQSKYVWTIDETTIDGVQHITVTNHDDNTKAFPVDGAKNQNFTGSGTASLKTEMYTAEGVDYIVLTLDDEAIGYVHANAPGGNPCLSYWPTNGDGASCIKFTFFPVDALTNEERLTYNVGDGKYNDRAGSNWRNGWTSTNVGKPSFTISVGANNVNAGSADYIGLRPGSGGCTYTLTLGETFTGYSFEAKSTNTAPNTNNPDHVVTINGKETTISSTEWTTVRADVVGTTASFGLKGSNSHDLHIRNIKFEQNAEVLAAATANTNMNIFGLQRYLGLVQSSDNYLCNYPSDPADGQGYPGLLDGNHSTYFHSGYSGRNPSPNGVAHYLQADLGKAIKSFRFYTRKRNDNDRPTKITIEGSNDKTSWSEVKVIEGIPTNAADYYSEEITSTTAYQYYRFTVNTTNTNKAFFTFSEFYIFSSEYTRVKETFDAVRAYRAGATVETATALNAVYAWNKGLNEGSPIVGVESYIYADTYKDGTFLNRYLYNNNGTLTLTTELSGADSFVWTPAVTDDGKYNFKNKVSKYLAHRGMSDNAHNFTVAATTHHMGVTLHTQGSNYWVIKNADGGFEQSSTTYDQKTTDYCTDFVFIPTNLYEQTFEPVVLKSAEEFENGGIYTFVTKRGWMGAKEGDNVISTAKTSHGVTGSASDAMFQWTVYKSNNGIYYLYNIGKQRFMGVQSNNNASIPFAEQPAGRNLTFKQSSSADYPIMFSTDNAGVANHSTSYGDGLITWTGGWNTLNDEGSNHKVTLVKKLTDKQLEAIATKVEAYEKEIFKADLQTRLAEAQAFDEYINSDALSEAIAATEAMLARDASSTELKSQIDVLTAAITSAVYVTKAEEFSNNAIYTFVTPRGWVGGDDETEKVIGTVKSGVTVNPAASATNAYFQWAVYKSNNGNYYLYNLGKEKFLALLSDNTIAFVDNPTSKALTFKQSSSSDYPIMISPDNKGTVSQNANAGLFYWNSGLDNPGDTGNTHQVTNVGVLDPETLATIAELVEAYDKILPVKAEVIGGLEENNPNTHFGSVRATSTSGSLSTKLKTVNINEVAYIDYEGTQEIIIDFFREYRGFEFQGYYLGEESLGESFTLTEAQEANITEQNPLIAKFTATEAVTLFYDDDEFSYRIPAIERTSTDRLIAVSDYRHSLDDIGRYNHGAANPGIDLVIRTSDNNGKTWSETKTIAAGTGVRGANDCAYGDAAIAVVGQKVLVMAAAGDVFFPNADASNNNRVVRIWNEGNGDGDWSKEDISTELFLGENALFPNGYAAFFGSGRMPVDETGRIYGAMLLRNAAAGNNIYVVYSDNLGDTWEILGGSQTQVARADEPKVEILPNGQILLSARRGGGRHFRVFTYGTGETDWANGVGTWSNTKNGCGNGGSNGTNGEIYHLEALNANGQRVNILLQSQPKGGSNEFDRKDVTIWYKEITETNGSYTIDMIADNWREGLQVSYQKSAYSAMTLQEDGRMAFFFEEAPCYGDDHSKGYSMVYMPLTIEEITKSNYFSLDADLTTEHTINVVLTDAQGNEYRDQVTSALGGVAAKLTTDYPFITLGDNAALESDGENFTYTNTVTLPFKVSNEETTVWHNMYIPSNTNARYPVYFYAESNANTTVKTKATSVEYGASDYNTQEHADKMSWAIYNVDNGFAFTFKNKLTGKYIKVAQPASGKSENVQYDTKENATAFSIEKNTSYRGDYIIKHETGHLSVNGAGDGHLTFFSGNYHWGSTVKIAEAPDFEALFDEVNAVLSMFGNSLAMYKVTDDVGNAQSAMQNSSIVNLNTLNSYKNLLTGAELNQPQKGKFYRLKGKASGNYMNATANTEKFGMASETECDAMGSVFYLTENNKLLNYKLGTYLYDTYSVGAMGESNGNEISFNASESRNVGYFTLKTNYSGSQYIYDGTDIVNRNGSYVANHCEWKVEEVTALPVNVNASLGLASFYAPVALTIPEGMTAYVVTGVTGDKAPIKVLAERDEVIPANTGVLLEAVGGSYTLEIVDNFVADETVTNLLNRNILRGTVDVQYIDSVNNETYYMLSKIDGEPGFYQVAINLTSSGNKVEVNGTHFKNNGFKSYLAVPGGTGAGATALRLYKDTTSIDPIEATDNAPQQTGVYDLQGRRVEHPGKGLYIVNGKKVIF